MSDHQLAQWPPNVIRADITRPLRYPTNSMDAVYASHTLEHVYLSDIPIVLKEIARVLRPRGYLRLAFPDPEAIAANLLACHGDGDAGPGLVFNRELHSHPIERPRGTARLRDLLGASYHRWQPTRDLVIDLMERSGFVGISERKFRDSTIAGIETVEHRKEGWFVEGASPPF